MKHLKKFNEGVEDTWNEIISQYDVYQLYDLLIFKYGPIFKETKSNIDDYDGDYNPDELYPIIEDELKSLGKYDDFVSNYEQYGIEKDEADPFHWRHRQKEMDKLTKSWDNKFEGVVNYESDNIKNFYEELSKCKGQIPFDQVLRIGEKNDIEVLNYDQFYKTLSGEDLKAAPPKGQIPFFALLSPKSNKIQLVLQVKAIDKNMLQHIYHIMKHENVHLGQYNRKKIKTRLPLAEPMDRSKYFSNNKGESNEIMAHSQSIVDMIMTQENPKTMKQAISLLRRNGLYNNIKNEVSIDVLQKYKKYIYLYLEKEFDKK